MSGGDPGRYWDERLRAAPGLTGVGRSDFDARYNHWLYRAQRDRLDELLARHAVAVAGARVLDAGSGVGFFVDFFLARGAAAVTGLDISEGAVAGLRARFPGQRFLLADLGDPAFDEAALGGPFDLVSAMSVLFHVVDDRRFERALGRLAASVAPGGHLVLSDTLRPPGLHRVAHVRTRPREAYEAVLAARGLEVVAVAPLHHLLNRSFVPRLGPRAIGALRLGALLYRLDGWLARRGVGNAGNQKLLLATAPPRPPAGGGPAPRRPAPRRPTPR